MRQRLEPRHGEEGFTLLELMVVVAIIAIIAGILVPNFFHARAQAAVSACMANMRSIATAAELYYSDHQAYPPATSEVTSAFGVDSTGSNGQYLNQTPIDPAGGQYGFQLSGPAAAASGYTISCTGNHDPSSLSQLAGHGSGTTHIQYSSSQGFSATSGS
ncbi:MAG TPA: prepilin-type N-terminal cleavage/methylation domain-containing protein [Candidatus Baltobacteraceae bacterium]|nr:prepilin-type N-terminal cleavage/methylation domain-containing protein [Candidatus Baltobacteraceae bacterium]